MTEEKLPGVSRKEKKEYRRGVRVQSRPKTSGCSQDSFRTEVRAQTRRTGRAPSAFLVSWLSFLGLLSPWRRRWLPHAAGVGRAGRGEHQAARCAALHLAHPLSSFFSPRFNYIRLVRGDSHKATATASHGQPRRSLIYCWLILKYISIFSISGFSSVDDPDGETRLVLAVRLSSTSLYNVNP